MIKGNFDTKYRNEVSQVAFVGYNKTNYDPLISLNIRSHPVDYLTNKGPVQMRRLKHRKKINTKSSRNSKNPYVIPQNIALLNKTKSSRMNRNIQISAIISSKNRKVLLTTLKENHKKIKKSAKELIKINKEKLKFTEDSDIFITNKTPQLSPIKPMNNEISIYNSNPSLNIKITQYEEIESQKLKKNKSYVFTNQISNF